MKKRIWELDAFRGLCILGMIGVHLVYDLVELYSLVDWNYSSVFSFVKNWGGVLFLLLSGVCATLGSRSGRRGLIVFACGMICSAVTAGMYYLHLADRSIIIWFGVLHCLGICMMLWCGLKKLPTWVLGILGAVLIGLGFWFRGLSVGCNWLFPLGLLSPGFTSSDYFPLLPNLGFFLVGALGGRTLYRKKTSLFPNVNSNLPAIRFFTFCGRQSLWIYLLHQPVLALICQLLSLL